MKELNRLKKLNCGDVSCYIKTIQMNKKSTKIQLCSTFMDMSDDNNDLNDFLGTAMKKKKVLSIIIHNTVLPVLDRSKEFQSRSFMSL